MFVYAIFHSFKNRTGANWTNPFKTGKPAVLWADRVIVLFF